MPLGDSSKLRVGDYVVAIGNPFGFSQHRHVGHRQRARPQRTSIADAYEDFIQTDASINPGNSGGALVNLRGELVGINSAIISRSGGNIGIGFAIPVEHGALDHGSARHVRLGEPRAARREHPRRHARSRSDQQPARQLAARWFGSIGRTPARERAGIQVGDVIISINEHSVRDSGSLKAAIGLLRPGEKVVRRGAFATAIRSRSTRCSARRRPRPPHAAPSEDQPGTAPLDPARRRRAVRQRRGKRRLVVARVEPAARPRSAAYARATYPINRARAQSRRERMRAIILESSSAVGVNQLILMR